MKILFTCLGNICRSPIAEGIMKAKIKQQNLSWEVSSNGTNRYHKGDGADIRSIRVCKNYGINISNHVARRFKTEDFYSYNLIVCMAQDVYDELQEFVTDKGQLGNVIVKAFDDPWYGGEEGFEKCYQKIEKYCEELIRVNS